MPRGRPRRERAHPDRTDDLFGGELRCDPLYFEGRARRAGFSCVAGLDEAGRGPLAGPVVAAAVVLPLGVRLPGVDDSKRLSGKQREEAFSLLQKRVRAIGVGVVEAEEIDQLNIHRASLKAMEKAVAALP